ncbi:MAG: Rieske 2Fe-2S domain-containing protein [Chloroflexi bacterium]|nr:Rieske 2Fe-2S domain-containing protein [Chloroflexota bacterium]
MEVLAVAIDMHTLVDRARGLVSRRIMADEEIYRLELERIFNRCWLFLAHESQLAKPGQFVTTWMGDEPVIVTRDSHGQVHAMINSCRHRGNSVCRAEAGRTSSFMCTYHGWTYGLDGQLVGVPGYEERYHGDLDRRQWGLIPVSQVASYKGLIFGTFDPQAPPLEEYLGDARWALDYILDQRSGGTEVVGGVFKWLINSNWKLSADNVMGDNYHGAITHRSATTVGHQTLSRIERRNNGRGDDLPAGPGVRPGFSAPLGWGHGFMCDLQPPGDHSFMEHPEPLRSYYRETLPELERRLGPMRARVKKINLTLFPHASFTTSSNMLHVWHPRGPTQTEVWLYVIVDKDAPDEVKQLLRQSAQRHFSPSGMFEQDDMDNWELSTQAAGRTISRNYPLHYGMGLGHEGWEDDGVVSRQINAINDESNQRAFYYGWDDFISSGNWDALRRKRAAWESGQPVAEGAALGG